MEAGMASLGHISLDGSKFKANTSKHKAMSYGRLKAKEKELTEEIEDLLAKAAKCDEEEDEEYQDKTGYEIPEELKIKEKRLAKIKEAKEALEKREQELNPGKQIDDKKQISFADKEARIMGKKGNFDYSYNGQISVNANDKQEAYPVFGQIKNSGFRGFSLRGYEKASGEFSLACAVHNFKKIVKAIFGGKICLESGRLAPMAA